MLYNTIDGNDTITDVAKHAGVSPVTVSRVINNSESVSAATREKVERAIFLYNTNENPLKQQRCIDVVVAQRVDGVIIILAGPRNTSTAEHRITGYRLALAETGISIDHRLIKRGEYRIASGEELTDQVLGD